MSSGANRAWCNRQCCRRGVAVSLLQRQRSPCCRYITNCGTEGNLHGILVGRENLPDGENPARSVADTCT